MPGACGSARRPNCRLRRQRGEVVPRGSDGRREPEVGSLELCFLKAVAERPRRDEQRRKRDEDDCSERGRHLPLCRRRASAHHVAAERAGHGACSIATDHVGQGFRDGGARPCPPKGGSDRWTISRQPSPPQPVRARARPPARSRRCSRRWSAKSGYSNEHAVAVSAIAMVIAAQLRLDRLERAALAVAALLHDVGKVVVPDAILGKPGPLDAEEWTVMRSHSAVGAQPARAAPRRRRNRGDRPQPSRALGRTGIPGWACGTCHSARREDRGGGRCVPGDDGSASVSERGHPDRRVRHDSRRGRAPVRPRVRRGARGIDRDTSPPGPVGPHRRSLRRS